MAEVRLVPFRAADVNQAWVRNERFWPCPPVPVQQDSRYYKATDDIAEWLARESERIIREENARIAMWVRLSEEDERKRGVLIVRNNPGGPILYINLDERVPQNTIHEYPKGIDEP